MPSPTANAVLRRRRLILDRLHMARLSQGQLARRCGVTRSMVCHVIAGRKSSPKIQRAVARACAMRASTLWED